MPEAPYLAERQTEYWTSREIENALLDEGWEVLVFPLTQQTEHQVPVDFLFLDQTRVKVFGVQYKALYHNSSDHWRLDRAQHARLRKNPWMFYFLSEMKVATQHRQALHYTRISRPGFRYRQKVFREPKKGIRKVPYFRWAAFLTAFRKCKLGKKLASKTDFEALLRRGTNRRLYDCDIQRMVEVYGMNLEMKRVLKVTNISAEAFELEQSVLNEPDANGNAYENVEPDEKEDNA